MKLFWAPAAILLVLAGCAPDAKAPSETPVAATAERVPPPDFKSLEMISDAPRLFNENREVHVGQEVSEAENLIARPRRAADFRDLPPSFGAGYRSRGWEGDGEGFGIISYTNRVVVAVHTIGGVDERRLETMLTRYRTASELKPDVAGESARYWFNAKGSIQLMLCAVQGKDGLYITEAVGWDRAMQALRMNPLQAENDVRKADKPPVEKPAED